MPRGVYERNKKASKEGTKSTKPIKVKTVKSNTVISSSNSVISNHLNTYKDESSDRANSLMSYLYNLSNLKGAGYSSEVLSTSIEGTLTELNKIFTKNTGSTPIIESTLVKIDLDPSERKRPGPKPGFKRKKTSSSPEEMHAEVASLTSLDNGVTLTPFNAPTRT